MSVQERMRMCRLIDQMESRPAFCKRLGLENRSTFHGSLVDENYGKGRGKLK
ncbi:MAG: hypothetical protein ACI4AD_00700 [Roseburia sp.]